MFKVLPYQQPRLRQERASDSYPLALPSAELNALVTHVGLIPGRKAHHELMRACRLTRLSNLILAGVGPMGWVGGDVWVLVTVVE